MKETKRFLDGIIRKDQYEVLRSVADKFGNTPEAQFGCKGNRYITTDREGYVTRMLISNFSMRNFYQPPTNKRKFEVPNQLTHLQTFNYDCDSGLGELVIPDECNVVEEVSSVNGSLEKLQLPKELGRLKTLRCFGNSLVELHLKTAENLENLEIHGNRISGLYLPQSMPNLRLVRWHGNPLPKPILDQLERYCPGCSADAIPMNMFERALRGL